MNFSTSGNRIDSVELTARGSATSVWNPRKRLWSIEYGRAMLDIV
jgi:hypothetical protein